MLYQSFQLVQGFGSDVTVPLCGISTLHVNEFRISVFPNGVLPEPEMNEKVFSQTPNL